MISFIDVAAFIAVASIFKKNIFLIKAILNFEFKFYHELQNMHLLETDSIYFIK